MVAEFTVKCEEIPNIAVIRIEAVVHNQQFTTVMNLLLTLFLIIHKKCTSRS